MGPAESRPQGPHAQNRLPPPPRSAPASKTAEGATAAQVTALGRAVVLHGSRDTAAERGAQRGDGRGASSVHLLLPRRLLADVREGGNSVPQDGASCSAYPQEILWRASPSAAGLKPQAAACPGDRHAGDCRPAAAGARDSRGRQPGGRHPQRHGARHTATRRTHGVRTPRPATARLREVQGGQRQQSRGPGAGGAFGPHEGWGGISRKDPVSKSTKLHVQTRALRRVPLTPEFQAVVCFGASCRRGPSRREDAQVNVFCASATAGVSGNLPWVVWGRSVYQGRGFVSRFVDSKA